MTLGGPGRCGGTSRRGPTPSTGTRSASPVLPPAPPPLTRTQPPTLTLTQPAPQPHATPAPPPPPAPPQHSPPLPARIRRRGGPPTTSICAAEVDTHPTAAHPAAAPRPRWRAGPGPAARQPMRPPDVRVCVRVCVCVCVCVCRGWGGTPRRGRPCTSSSGCAGCAAAYRSGAPAPPPVPMRAREAAQALISKRRIEEVRCRMRAWCAGPAHQPVNGPERP